MCACLPGVNLLFDRLRTKVPKSYTSSSNQHRRRNGHGGSPFPQGSADRQLDSTTATWTLNTELAVLPAQEEAEGSAPKGPGVGQAIDDEGRCVRIDSTQGRSEGWLAEPAQVAQV